MEDTWINTEPLKSWVTRNTHMTILQNPEATKHYRYKSVDKVLNNLDAIIDMIEHHQKYQVPRLIILYEYSIGNNVGIRTRPRRLNPEKSDVRIPHPFGPYIKNFNSGYEMGVPINVDYDDEDIGEKLKEFNKINNVDALNSKMGVSKSVYGRSYEMQYRDTEGIDKVVATSVYNTFVVYDRTIEHKPLFGIYYTIDDNTYNIEMHTSEEIIYFSEYEKKHEKLTIEERTFHDREDVDIIETPNNDERKGDAEPVIPIIDAYDYLVSDLVNFKNDTNEAIMYIKGNPKKELLEADDKQIAKALKESDLMVLEAEMGVDGGPNGTLDIGYLERTFNVSGFESIKDNLKKDIFELSNTPNFNEDSFVNAPSGIATRYKMYISDQKAKSKTHYVKETLRKRYRMWARFKEWQEEMGTYDTGLLTIKTHTNLPVSYAEEIEAHVKAGGKLSLETQLSQLSIVDDVAAEIARIAKEELAKRGSVYDDQLSAAVSEITQGGE